MGDYRSMMYQPTDFKGPIVALIFGATLIWLPLALNISSQTVFHQVTLLDEVDPLSLERSSVDFLVSVLFQIMKVVGIISFVRGWMMMTKLGNQQSAGQGLMGRAIVHILFGVLSFHMAASTLIACNTLNLSCDIVNRIV